MPMCNFLTTRQLHTVIKSQSKTDVTKQINCFKWKRIFLTRLYTNQTQSKSLFFWRKVSNFSLHQDIFLIVTRSRVPQLLDSQPASPPVQYSLISHWTDVGVLGSNQVNCELALQKKFPLRNAKGSLCSVGLVWKILSTFTRHKAFSICRNHITLFI